MVTLNAGVTSYIDNNCPVYTTFYYVVTAIDRNSESGYSGVVGAFSLADGVMIEITAGLDRSIDIFEVQGMIVWFFHFGLTAGQEHDQ